MQQYMNKCSVYPTSNSISSSPVFRSCTTSEGNPRSVIEAAMSDGWTFVASYFTSAFAARSATRILWTPENSEAKSKCKILHNVKEKVPWFLPGLAK